MEKNGFRCPVSLTSVTAENFSDVFVTKNFLTVLLTDQRIAIGASRAGRREGFVPETLLGEIAATFSFGLGDVNIHGQIRCHLATLRCGI